MDAYQRNKAIDVNKLHETIVSTVVATTDGTGTAVIPATAEICTGVGVDSQVNYWVTLPDPTLCPDGHEITLTTVYAYEIRTSAPTTISLNGVVGSGKELAVAAATNVTVKKISNTAWIAMTHTTTVPD